MSSNMPILWQNALMQYEDCPIAQKAWLWFTETRSNCRYHYDSDKYADEVRYLVLTIKPAIKSHSKRWFNSEDEVIDDLTRFILIRHANYRLASNVKPDFLRD